MTEPTPEEPAVDDRDAEGRDAEEIANEELPLDPAGPTELGGAVDG